MNVDSASSVICLAPLPPTEDEAPLAEAAGGGDAAATGPAGQVGHTIVLPTAEQLKILEEMGMPISKEELDTLRQQKAEQDKAPLAPLLQAGALPPAPLPANPY